MSLPALTHQKVCSHLLEYVTSSEPFMSDKSMYDLQRKLLTLLQLPARGWMLPLPSLRAFCVCHAWQQTQPLSECRRVKVWAGPRRLRSEGNLEVQLNCLLQRFNPVLVWQKIMRGLLTSTWEILTLAWSVFLSVSLAEELLSTPCRQVAQASLFRSSFEQECGFPSPKMGGCLAFN